MACPTIKNIATVTDPSGPNKPLEPEVEIPVTTTPTPGGIEKPGIDGGSGGYAGGNGSGGGSSTSYLPRTGDEGSLGVIIFLMTALALGIVSRRIKPKQNQ